MSNNTGAIKFEDGTIMYYEYYGTSDVVHSHSYNTAEEVSDNWRKGEWLECSCGREEPVSIYIGVGYYMSGKACRYCHSIDSDEMTGDFEKDQKLQWAKELLHF